MNSQTPGTTTSYGKVIRIEVHGFFLEAQEKQYFVPFADYPVFRRATVSEIFEMEARFPGCFHWPTIDADIGLDALEHPEKYPLAVRHNREDATSQQDADCKGGIRWQGDKNETASDSHLPIPDSQFPPIPPNSPIPTPISFTDIAFSCKI